MNSPTAQPSPAVRKRNEQSNSAAKEKRSQREAQPTPAVHIPYYIYVCTTDGRKSSFVPKIGEFDAKIHLNIHKIITKSVFSINFTVFYATFVP
jgi:hypothetical protein